MYPFSWAQLHDLHNQIIDIKLPRTDEVIRKYEEYKLTSEYKNFGLKTIMDKLTSEYKNQNIIGYNMINDLQTTGRSYFIVLENEFPYYLDTGIHHYVAWFVLNVDLDPHSHANASISMENISSLYRYLGAVLGTSDRIYCVFQNSLNLRSISAIPHAHVFTRNIRIQECIVPC